MEPKGERKDEFGIDLDWPTDELAGGGWDEEDVDAVAADADGTSWALEPLPTSGPILPAVAVRLEAVQSAVIALSTRIDALANASTSYRSLMTDRVSEYADTVSRLSRSQSTDLEEYRHATERVVAELRRSITDSEQALHRLDTRMDEVAADLANLAELSRTAIVEGRDASAGVDKVTRSVREGLEGFTNKVIERLDIVGDTIASDLDEVRSAAAGQPAAIEPRRRSSAGAAETSAGVAQELSSLRGQLEAAWAGTSSALVEEIAAARSDLAELRDALPEAVGGATDPALVEELGTLRAEIAALRRRMSVRAKGEASGGLDDAQVEAIVSAVVGRLSEAFEFVGEEPEQ
jgi:chromosome segregation ATPase